MALGITLLFVAILSLLAVIRETKRRNFFGVALLLFR